VYGGKQSVTSTVLFGVPQYTVWDHCCILYTAPLFDIIVQLRVNAYQYADDLQLYICVPLVEATIVADHLVSRRR